MGSVVVVVGDVLTDQAEQMPLPKHDDVIEQFAAQRADPPLGESVLPWRPRFDAARGRRSPRERHDRAREVEVESLILEAWRAA
jgi:hypothetical protein